MANGYVTIHPCTLDEIVEAAKADGFAVSDPRYDSNGNLSLCGLIHADERGCCGLSEEEGADGWTYVGCMNDPKVPGYEMQQDPVEGLVDDDEDEDEGEDGH